MPALTIECAVSIKHSGDQEARSGAQRAALDNRNPNGASQMVKVAIESVVKMRELVTAFVSLDFCVHQEEERLRAL